MKEKYLWIGIILMIIGFSLIFFILGIMLAPHFYDFLIECEFQFERGIR